MAGTCRTGTAVLAAGAALLLAGCAERDPVRNLANQSGNAGRPAGGTGITLTQPVWEKPLPPPGPIVVGRRGR